LSINARPYLKNKQNKKAWAAPAQQVQGPNANSSTPKKKRRRKRWKRKKDDLQILSPIM
jgi:hypothetical protein